MALRLVHTTYDTVADRVVAEWPTTSVQEGVETLTTWCIDNCIVYPDPIFNEIQTKFLGWEFNDKSRVIFDDDNKPHKV